MPAKRGRPNNKDDELKSIVKHFNDFNDIFDYILELCKIFGHKVNV